MMKTQLLSIVAAAVLSSLTATGAGRRDPPAPPPGKVVERSEGLHGYIGFSASAPPAKSEYSVAMGFYSAVWPLVDKPLADFQIGLDQPRSQGRAVHCETG